MFLLLGGVYAAMQLVACLFMFNPPKSAATEQETAGLLTGGNRDHASQHAIHNIM